MIDEISGLMWFEETICELSSMYHIHNIYKAWSSYPTFSTQNIKAPIFRDYLDGLLSRAMEKGMFTDIEFPTQSIVQKWLRETKDLHIGICYSHKLFWYYEIMSVSNHVLVGLANRPSIHYNTYEEALEAGIQEALKLI